MKKLEIKTIYWGFPVCVLSTLNDQNKTNITPISSIYNVNDYVMIGLNSTSKAYENIKLNKKVILNVIPSSMWIELEKIANTTSSISNDQKNKIYLEDKISNTNLELKQTNYGIDFIKDTTLYIEALFEEEIVKNGVAHMCLSVQSIYANEKVIDTEGYIDEEKMDVLIYQLRKYKKLQTSEIGRSFRYSKSK